MLALGADPDLHQAAHVILDEHDRIYAYSSTTVPKRFTGPTAVGRVLTQLGKGLPTLTSEVDVVVVEGQEFYAQSHVDANDLIVLAQVTGGMSRRFRTAYPDAFHVIPRPRDWRNIPKEVDQRKITARLEAAEVNAEFLSEAHSHLLDAAGLALFAHSDRGKAYLIRMKALWRA